MEFPCSINLYSVSVTITIICRNGPPLWEKKREKERKKKWLCPFWYFSPSGSDCGDISGFDFCWSHRIRDMYSLILNKCRYLIWIICGKSRVGVSVSPLPTAEQRNATLCIFADYSLNLWDHREFYSRGSHLKGNVIFGWIDILTLFFLLSNISSTEYSTEFQSLGVRSGWWK